MTQLAFANRVQETANSIGTGTVSLLGAASTDVITFATAGFNGKTVPYLIRHRTSGQWEAGYGIYTSAGAQLTRVVVLSNSDRTTTQVNFASGTVDVFNDLPAEKVVALDADSSQLTLPGNLAMGGNSITGAQNGTFAGTVAAALLAGALAFASITGLPTTAAGYGISDVYTKTAADARYAPIAGPFPWADVTGAPTTVAGYGITDAYTKTQADARYPQLVTGPFAWAGVTGAPTTIAGYGITDAYTKTAADARYVQSVTGTTGRIAITGTTTAPIVNIDPGYVGQATITTLGTVTSGTWNGTAIGPTFGGTGIVAYAAGDLLYGSATNTLSRLAAGSNGQVLNLTGGDPSWHTMVTADISDLATAATGITRVGNITTGGWSGTAIGTPYGGTGLTAYATGDLIYGSAINTLGRLPGNTATTRMVLLQTGNGTVANAPQWTQLTAADILAGTFPGAAYTVTGTLTVGGATSLQGLTATGATISGTTATQALTASSFVVTSTTAPQFTVAYDGTHSYTVSVASNGNATLNATGTLTVTPNTTHSGTLTVNGATSLQAVTAAGLITANAGLQVATNVGAPVGGLGKSASQGFVIAGVTGSANDFILINGVGATVVSNPTGTLNIVTPGSLTAAQGVVVTGAVPTLSANSLALAFGSSFSQLQAVGPNSSTNGQLVIDVVNTTGAGINAAIVSNTGLWTMNAGLTITASGLTVQAGGIGVSAGGATITGATLVANTTGQIAFRVASSSTGDRMRIVPNAAGSGVTIDCTDSGETTQSGRSITIFNPIISSNGIVAATVNTALGVAASVPSGTFTTFYTLPASGVYRVFTFIAGAGSNYWTSADIIYDGGTAGVWGKTVGATVDIQVNTGAVVQTKQSSGAAQAVNWYIIRIG